MAKKRVHELAKDRGMAPADVLDELKSAGHKVASVASSVEEQDAVRVLDVGVRLVRFERDGEFVGAVVLKAQNDLEAYQQAAEVAPEHTHAQVQVAGFPWEAYDVAPKDRHMTLLSERELAELVERRGL